MHTHYTQVGLECNYTLYNIHTVCAYTLYLQVYTVVKLIGGGTHTHGEHLLLSCQEDKD